VAQEERQHAARRASFDGVAALYDRARPVYPPALFDDLVELAGLHPGSRLLEIGPGPGKATRPLAERGLHVTAVELGERLAEVARAHVAGLPAEIVVADFETWQPTHAGFDVVAAFTSFHWIDPELRYRRTAALLRDGGALAITATHHVLPPDGDDFFVDVQADYEAILPDDATTRHGPPGPPEAATGYAAEVAASGLFGPVEERRHVFDVTFDADGYCELLQTHSRTRVLADDVRDRLLARIRRRIEARPDGRVRTTYLALLEVARKA
jgi:SAM-dependent methyltransferase